MHPRINYKAGRIGHIDDVDSISLVDVFRDKQKSKCILKMYIEGSEYESLDLNLNVLRPCQCLIIEFHDMERNMEVFIHIVEKISVEYLLINTHINNFGPVINGIPTVIELCFIRRSLTSEESFFPAINIPHSLDRPCNPNKTEFTYTY